MSSLKIHILIAKSNGNYGNYVIIARNLKRVFLSVQKKTSSFSIFFLSPIDKVFLPSLTAPSFVCHFGRVQKM